MRRLSLLLMLAAGLAATGPDIPPQLTLSEGLNLALTNSTILREAMAQLDQTSGQYLQSRSALLPQLGVFARQGIQTISLQGLGIDIPGLPPSAQQGKVGPFGSMDARAVLSVRLLRNWRNAARRSARSSS